MNPLVIVAALLSGLVAALLGALRSAARRRLARRADAAGLPLDGPSVGRWRGARRCCPALRGTARSGPGAVRTLPAWVVKVGTSVLMGGGLALSVTGLPGLVLGVLTGAAGHRWLPDPPSAEDRRRQLEQARLREQLPLTADLLAGCLSSWCDPATAAEAVAGAVGGPMAVRLARVAAEIRTGADAEDSWGRFGADPVLAPLGRCLIRASTSGAPPAAGLARLAEGSREAAATAAQGRVRRAGVLAVAPLGLCFLPAFVALGVVPVVTGLTGNFLVQL